MDGEVENRERSIMLQMQHIVFVKLSPYPRESKNIFSVTKI